jgi:hypothetical protein
VILAQHEEEINIVRVGDSRDKTPVEDDLSTRLSALRSLTNPLRLANKQARRAVS